MNEGSGVESSRVVAASVHWWRGARIGEVGWSDMVIMCGGSEVK